MTRASLITITFSTAMLGAVVLRAQRPELNTQADVEQHVMSALSMDKAHGELAELATALGLRGSFTFDMTVEHNGDVAVLFPVESTIASIPSQTS